MTKPDAPQQPTSDPAALGTPQSAPAETGAATGQQNRFSARCRCNLDQPCPVVRTVGDLTARHVGRQVIVDGLHAILGTLPWQDPDGVWRVGLNGYGEVCSIDTPCEVLP